MCVESKTLMELREVLAEKGYIRGPFGSALRRPELKDEGIPIYEQQHAIYNIRDFRFFIDESKFNELKRFQVRSNDLIISCSGTVGRIS
jgi:type I restriction enzyme S subunit